VTPFCSASFAIATPVGPSSGHMIRTLAPRLMSAVASLSSVASLPCALSMRYCAGVYPAASKDCLIYGASKSTHRVDDVVSGRITPTSRLLAPLVAAAVRPLNWDIVDAMSTVKELMLSPDGIVPLAAGEADVAGADVAGADELDELDELDEDEQPAAAKATTAAAATQPSRGKRLPP